MCCSRWLCTRVWRKNRGRSRSGDVCTGICKKLIYRHPHIFGDAGAQTPDEALQNWEALKRREKHREGAGDDLDSVPAALPALMRSRKVAKRAADHGFTYPDAQAAIADLEQELTELKQAVAQGQCRMRSRRNWATCCFLRRTYRAFWTATRKRRWTPQR